MAGGRPRLFWLKPIAFGLSFSGSYERERVEFRCAQRVIHSLTLVATLDAKIGNFSPLAQAFFRPRFFGPNAAGSN